MFQSIFHFYALSVSLRRQVHDKSYWLAVLSAKIKELQTEHHRLGRAAEQLQKDQSRTGMLKQSAEQSARELQSKNQALIVLNEYFERLRIPDALQDVKEEVHMINTENDQLAEHLEHLFSQKRLVENESTVLNQTMVKNRNRALNLRRQLDEEQQKR
jgi:hypothetical protein